MDTSQVSPADVRAQLERMLASEIFRGAERSKTLLSFIVEETLKGGTDRLKDYTLGFRQLPGTDNASFPFWARSSQALPNRSFRQTSGIS